MKQLPRLAATVTFLSLTACEQPTPSVTPQAHTFSVKVESEIARNLEQVAYCLPIPKGEYVRDDATELPRGSLAYKHKTRKADTIEIRGLLRADTRVEIKDYFYRTYAGAEESGKIIEEKNLLKAQRVFYARGYWSNKIHKERFIEVTWVRRDDVVVYTANFPLAEANNWQSRLSGLLRHTSQCD